MSTRASIIVKDNNDTFWLYRQSDGNPEGTMPTLQKFIRWVREGKIRKHAEMAAGWLILIGAEEYGKYWDCDSKNNYKEMKKKTVLEPLNIEGCANWKCGAYEFSRGRPGDIAYLYVIDLEAKTITCYDANWDRKEGSKDFGHGSGDKKLFVDTEEEPWVKKEDKE